MTALTLLAAYVLGVVGVARATRLVVFDPYPPIAALRLRYITWQESRDWDDAAMRERTGPAHGWAGLVTCQYCFAPYPAAVALALAILGDLWEPDLTTLGGWWLTLAVWASGSYLAAVFVSYDEPASD
jgi:hypothetical protein